jgi:hypothetical protein
MAISIDPATKVISVPQADLTFVSGTLYTLDSNQFKKDVMALLAAEDGIWMEDAFVHNTEVTVAGTTFARTIEFVNGYSITFEDTGAAYTVRIEGSNNNIFDAESGILNPTSLTTVISTNSAGLINGQITDQLVEGTLSVNDALRIILAASAGKLSGAATTTVTIRDTGDSTDRIVATVDVDGNRTAVTLDPS